MEVECMAKRAKFSGQGAISDKHVPADVYVVKANAMGETPIHCRSHLGRLLSPGDTVLGFDMANSNINDPNFEKLKQEKIPDVILVKKHYPDQKQKRRWKLRHFLDKMDVDSANQEYEDFLQDLEEDPAYRDGVNIYKDQVRMRTSVELATTDDEGERPKITLEEMLDDLTLSEADGDAAEWEDVEDDDQ